MNILIEAGYNKHITVDPSHTDALVALLPYLRMVDESGYGESTVYQMGSVPPNITFVESKKLAPLSEVERALKKALEDKSSDWASAYTEKEQLKKRLAALESQQQEAA